MVVRMVRPRRLRQLQQLELDWGDLEGMVVDWGWREEDRKKGSKKRSWCFGT